MGSSLLGTERPLTGQDKLMSLRGMCVSHTCNELPFKIKLMFLSAKRAKLHLHLIPSSDTVSPGSHSPPQVLPSEIAIISQGLGCGHLQQTKITWSLHAGIWCKYTGGCLPVCAALCRNAWLRVICTHRRQMGTHSPSPWQLLQA